MKKIVLSAFILGLVALVSPAYSFIKVESVNLSGGVKLLNKDDWEPVENQPLLGLEGEVSIFALPVNFVAGYAGSGLKADLGGTDFEGIISEVYFGIRKYYLGAFFVGGGISSISAKYKDFGAGSESDSATGFYTEAGVSVNLLKVRLGLKGVYSSAEELNLVGANRQAGGFQAALFAGWNI